MKPNVFNNVPGSRSVNKDKRWTSKPHSDLTEFEFALFAAILLAHQNREPMQPQQIGITARLVHLATRPVLNSSR
jgi:hypothetical protein